MLNGLNVLRRRVPYIFYGWWIVLSSCVLQILRQGLLNQGFTIYFVPLQAEFGWSRTLISSGFSLCSFEAGVLGPLEGWLTDRFGPRIVVITGTILLGSGFIILSTIHSIGAYFATFIMIAAGSSLGGFLPIQVAIVKWFVRKRSLALGIAMAGAGLAGVIVPVIAWSMTTHGWRTTAFVSGLIIWLIGIPMALLLRHRPEKYGFLPDGDLPSSSNRSNQEHPNANTVPQDKNQVDDSFSTMEALKSRAFWLIAAGHAFAVLTVAAISLHIAPHLVQQLSISLEAVSGIVALMLIVSAIGRVIGGFLADRTNKRVLLVACMLSHTTGLLILAYATSMVHVYLFAIFHGIAWGARVPAVIAIRADYFGRKSIGLILGLSAVATTLASVIARIFAGWLADLRGDYQLAFTILAIITALGSLFFAFASKPTRKFSAVSDGEIRKP